MVMLACKHSNWFKHQSNSLRVSIVSFLNMSSLMKLPSPASYRLQTLEFKWKPSEPLRCLLCRTLVNKTKFDLMFCRQDRTCANGVTNSSERIPSLDIEDLVDKGGGGLSQSLSERYRNDSRREPDTGSCNRSCSFNVLVCVLPLCSVSP